MPRPTLDDIFEEPDEFGLLEVKLKSHLKRPPNVERDASIVRDVNEFYERNGRLPNEDALDHDEMKLAVIWSSIKGRADAQAFAEFDEHGLLNAEPQQAEAPTRTWRDDPTEDEIPRSLDDILDDDDLDVSSAFTSIKHVTPAADRMTPDHRAEFYPCEDFGKFEKMFEDLHAEVEAGKRGVEPINPRDMIEPIEGDVFIRNGHYAYIAEKSEMTTRGGKRDHRLRVIFDHGVESDPLMSSFRKALASDSKARIIDRKGIGPLDPNWEENQLELTGTIYVARSMSEEPAVKDVSNILIKIGVTSQDVKKRVADAKNDPTFLLAPVTILRTYELQNLSRKTVEEILHKFFAAARPTSLYIKDRFGKKISPKEWFYLMPEHVDQAVKYLKDGTLHLYLYDPNTQTIQLRGAK
jgi:hypothetical protein